MKTLKQIKNRFALEKGYYDWLDLFLRLTEGEITQNKVTFMQYEEEMMKIYAMECLKLASENAEVVDKKSPSGSWYFGVCEQSITNENNIIK